MRIPFQVPSVEPNASFDPVTLPWTHLWGKSRGLPVTYPLLSHLLDTAAMAGCLWDEYCTPSQRALLDKGTGGHGRAALMWWAAAHDIGKATPCFQQFDEGAWGRLVDAAPPLDTAMVEPDARLGHDVASGLIAARSRRWALLDRLDVPGSRNSVDVIAGHHGVYPMHDLADPIATASQVEALGGQAWEAAQDALLERLTYALRCAPPVAVDADAAVVATGLVVLADWLVSQRQFLLLAPKENVATLANARERLDSVRSLAMTTLRNSGLLSRGLPSSDGGVTGMFPGFDSRGVQVGLESDLPSLVGDGDGMLVITAPTGEGKTEAALWAASLLAERSGASGLYLALPTMATADEMLTRVLRWLGNGSEQVAVGLLHHMASLNPEMASLIEQMNQQSEADPFEETEVPAGPIAAEWLRGRHRGLLNPVGVGTIDQVLAAMLRAPHTAIRHLGLSGRVLVIDEAHAYDPYMQTLMARLLTWLGRYEVPVVLLSATLPQSVAGALVAAYQDGRGLRSTADSLPQVPYPGWVWVSGCGDVAVRSSAAAVERRLVLKPVEHVNQDPGTGDGGDDRWARIQHRLQPIRKDGGCVLLVCSTVASAQDTYLRVARWAAALPPEERPEIGLLHSRFPVWQRAAITAKIVSLFGSPARAAGQRPKRAVLVATQVVEQSLDLDFDHVISDLAPVALLLQRAGRCHRHQRPLHERGAWHEAGLTVLIPTSDGDGGDLAVPRGWPLVYPTAWLRRTRALIGTRSEIQVPNDVPELVDAVDRGEGLLDEDNPSAMVDEQRARGGERRDRRFARLAAVPHPSRIGFLGEMTSQDEAVELDLGTRLGAPSARVVPVIVDEHGVLRLASTFQVAPTRSGGMPLRRADVRKVLAASVPVLDASWVDRLREAHDDGEVVRPDGWAESPWLANLLLLPLHEPSRVSESVGPLLGDARAHGGQTLYGPYLDPHLGLVARLSSLPTWGAAPMTVAEANMMDNPPVLTAGGMIEPGGNDADCVFSSADLPPLPADGNTMTAPQQVSADTKWWHRTARWLGMRR